jgi:hypothetical protein
VWRWGRLHPALLKRAPGVMQGMAVRYFGRPCPIPCTTYLARRSRGEDEPAKARSSLQTREHAYNDDGTSPGARCGGDRANATTGKDDRQMDLPARSFLIAHVADLLPYGALYASSSNCTVLPSRSNPWNSPHDSPQ